MALGKLVVQHGIGAMTNLKSQVQVSPTIDLSLHVQVHFQSDNITTFSSEYGGRRNGSNEKILVFWNKSRSRELCMSKLYFKNAFLF